MYSFLLFPASVRRVIAGILTSALLLTAMPAPVFAALPSGFEIETVTGGLALPTALAFTPDGRIFVAEKGGVVRVVKNGVLLPDPLITLTDVNSYADHGLIGIAVDPNFATNGYVYLSYTFENTPGAHLAGTKTGRIVRITVTGDKSDESTKVVLVGTIGGNINTPSCEDYATGTDCIPSDSPSHSVGGLRFGPDGKLYATLGDGAHFDYVDVRAYRAQNLDSLGGKVLRINTDGTAPSDNPFYTGDPTANRSKVFAYGFRNMFRFNFRPDTGALYGGDVGWNTWEEVNVVKRGGNYGWPCREGAAPTTGYNCASSANMIDPMYTYHHDASTGAGAVVAGAFPSGTAYPAQFSNSYFFGDYALNWVKQMKVSGTDTMTSVSDFGGASDGTNGPVEFTTGIDGNIYFLSIYTGELKRITYTSGNRRPIAAIAATPTNGLAPLAVTFSSNGSNDPDNDPITYAWNFGDGATSALPNPSHTYSTNGVYRATLTVFDGKGGQDMKQVEIAVGNRAPTVHISSPTNGSLYRVGQTITASGEGNDPEDGTLPGSALSWRIILHHNIHIHILEEHTGGTVTFTAPDHNDPSVYTEVELTAVDSGGLTTKTSVNIYLDNNAATTTGNLIANPSLEEVDPVTPTNPKQWAPDWWGVMDPIFTYPVQGIDGASAAKLEVRSYTEGDAKWIFDPVFVAENTSYTYSEYYQATVPSALVVGFTYPDGTRSYEEFDQPISPAGTWTKLERTFTTPAGVRTATVLHVLRSNGTLMIDNTALMQTSGGGGTLDTVPPSVTLSTPSSGAELSGSASLAVTATDNVGVSGVRFFANGTQLGGEVTIAPYTFTWDTTGSANGPYTLTAVARDAAGNTATSAPVSVTIKNTTATTTTGTNLIQNPSLESVGGDGLPLHWYTDQWGTNSATFDYPIAGFSGARAARTNITSYTDGDAKWFFEEVPVSVGQSYTFSDEYQATAPTTLFAQFRHTNDSVEYLELGTVPGAATWQKASVNFTIPADVKSVTIFHVIAAVGSLAVDDAFLSNGTSGGGGGSTDTTPPSVTITAPSTNASLSGTATIIATSTDDVGVSDVQFLLDGTAIASPVVTPPYQVSLNTTAYPDGSHTLAAVARDLAGNRATSTVVVAFANNSSSNGGQNLIANASVETASVSNPSLPDSWKHSRTGTNSTTFSYPVTGIDGAKAVKVGMTQYTSGHAEWYWNDVPVTPGSDYDFGEYYKSTMSTTLVARYRLESGSFQRVSLGSVPTAPDWQHVNYRLTAPTSATSLTVLHELMGVGSLSIDGARLASASTTSNPPPPPPPPPVSMTVQLLSPTQGSTLSGFSTMTATATSPVDIAGVRFFANGVSLGNEVTASPYSFTWDTKTVPNGTYALTALARDTVGHTATSTSISVTVNNTVTPPPDSSNLIKNPSFESAGADSLPLNWHGDGWGANTATFDYPVSGFSGARAARTNITSYTDGDAKWYFDDVPVTAGGQYVFSDEYQATIPTALVARFTYADGSIQYLDLATVPASNSWQKASASLTIPTDVVTMTVFHLLAGVGSLAIDDASLAPGATTDTDHFAKGMVSLTFDDGWLSHYTTVFPMLNAAGMKGSFAIITQESLNTIPGNQVKNANLESASGALPTNWHSDKTGTNNAVFTYPTAGHESNSAAQVKITSYTSGDAKWYFDDVPVAAGDPYHYSAYIKSDVPTTMLARFTGTGGAVSFATIGTVPASPTWQFADAYFNVPEGTKSMTVYTALTGVGTLSIDDVSLEEIPLHVNPAQILEMQNAGHEIAVHTQNHVSLLGLPSAQLQSETEGARNDLLGIGINPANVLVYPYGDYDDPAIAALKSEGFIGARSVDRGYNLRSTDKFKLKIQQVDVNTTTAQVKEWVDNAVSTNTWLILMFHQVDDAGGALSTLPPNLQDMINYIKSQNVPVVTMGEGIAQMSN